METIQIDVFMLIVRKLPPSDVINLCSSCKRIRYFSMDIKWRNYWKGLVTTLRTSVGEHVNEYINQLDNIESSYFNSDSKLIHRYYNCLVYCKAYNGLDPITKKLLYYKHWFDGSNMPVSKADSITQIDLLALYNLLHEEPTNHFYLKKFEEYAPLCFSFLDLNLSGSKFSLLDSHIHTLMSIFLTYDNLRGIRLMISKGATLDDDLKDYCISGTVSALKILIEDEDYMIDYEDVIETINHDRKEAFMFLVKKYPVLDRNRIMNGEGDLLDVWSYVEDEDNQINYLRSSVSEANSNSRKFYQNYLKNFILHNKSYQNVLGLTEPQIDFRTPVSEANLEYQSLINNFSSIAIHKG